MDEPKGGGLNKVDKNLSVKLRPFLCFFLCIFYAYLVVFSLCPYHNIPKQKIQKRIEEKKEQKYH